MLHMTSGSWFAGQRVISAVNRGLGGKPSPTMAIVGPTREAFYGRLHEFGLGKFPARPFMYPALLSAMHNFPVLFAGLMFASHPALSKAGAAVEAEAKKLLSAGGGRGRDSKGRFISGAGKPSPPGQPPHTQTGNLRSSIKWEIL